MLKVNINLHFKGERNYIQGAAVFDALSDICLKAGMSTDTVKLTFKKMLNNGAIIIEERDFLDSDCFSQRHGVIRDFRASGDRLNV